MNTFGKLFTLTTFGESHGAAVGGIVDGMPAGVTIDTDFIQRELARRRPGQSHITTDRKEADQVELLSGVFEGKQQVRPLVFLFAIPINIQRTMIISVTSSVRHMPTIHITANMVFVTIVEAGGRLLALHFHVS